MGHLPSGPLREDVRVVTFKDVNVEELAKSDLELPKTGGFPAP